MSFEENNALAIPPIAKGEITITNNENETNYRNYTKYFLLHSIYIN